MIATAASRNFVTELPLTTGWEMSVDGEHFAPAKFPGTVASVMRDRNQWQFGSGIPFDETAHWFRCRFPAEPVPADEQVVLRIGGIATISEVSLNGKVICKCESMFASHEIDVTDIVQSENDLRIECLPLAAAIRERRGTGVRARWRTRVVNEPNLRWFRTTFLGRAPGFSPEPEPVGPWRPITLVHRRKLALENWRRQILIENGTGIIHMDVELKILTTAPRSGHLIAGGCRAPFDLKRQGNSFAAQAILRIPDVARWFPHTHGEPSLYPVAAEFTVADGSTMQIDDVPAGFRTLDAGYEHPAEQGLALSVNGSKVFCRGVVWTPPDPVSLATPPPELRRRLVLLRDAGINMVRVPGTMIYECEAFHRLCDELGILVWQDMMFANMDYPFADPAFHRTAFSECETELRRISRHPSTTVICGNSEIEQQAGMLGLDSKLARGAFFAEELPRIAAHHCPGVPYLPSAPCGGDQAFRTNTGVANYFGVGAYLRPLEDARRANVKFASECLAFANVPEQQMIDKIAAQHRGGISPVHFGWKRGSARDSGPGWDFEDIRDHYLKVLYSIDPAALRYSDIPRYWQLSRITTGEVMAEVFGEWRRANSGCGGGIILWSGDLEPGAGWGILDSDGRPKAAYWFLKRALASRTLWMTDEGLNGIDIHIANDRPAPLNAVLRVALYRWGEQKTAESEVPVSLSPATCSVFGLESILGKFVDVSYSFRFGPPAHDLVAASLHCESGDVPFAQNFRFPAGRPSQRVPIDQLGISCEGKTEILLTAKRMAWGVCVTAPGYQADDAYFGLEPGVKRKVRLIPNEDCAGESKPVLTAINAEGRLRL